MTSKILNCLNEESPGVIDSLLSEIVDSYGDALGDVYIITTKEGLVNQLRKDDYQVLRIKLNKRLKSSRLKIIHFSRENKDYLTYVLNEGEIEGYELEKGELESVRNSDLISIARKYSDETFLKSTNTYHFATPSHKHTDNFFRLGDSIREISVLDRISFWILREINDADFIYFDSWSIAALPLRALQILGKSTPFEALSSHPSRERSACFNELSKSKFSSLQYKSPLLLISVTSSGQFLKTFNDLFHKLNSNSFLKSFSIYSFSDIENSLCVLPYDVKNFDFHECEFCQQGSKALEIHPSSYYVKAINDVGITIKKELAEINKDFLNKYHWYLEDIVRFHKGIREKNEKHYSHYIDFHKFSLLNEFRDSLKVTILNKIKKDSVLICGYNDSVTEYLSENSNINIVIVKDPNDLNTDEIIHTLNKYDQLIVYDPVVINGRYFDHVNTILRENCKVGETINNVIFFAGLFRPTSQCKTNTLKKSLAYYDEKFKREFLFVETIILPDQGASCPWCLELSSLNKIIRPEFGRYEIYEKRIEVLNQVGEGISGDAALFQLESERDSISLGKGSYLGPESLCISGLVLAIGSVVQTMRESEDDAARLAPKFPLLNAFAANNFSIYTEGLIRAAIIRSVSNYEFGVLEKEKTIDILFDELEKENQKIMFGEFYISILIGKFPLMGVRRGKILKLLGTINDRYPELDGHF